MIRTMRSRLMWLVAAAPGLFLLAGCDNTGHARYSPTKDEARSSLEAAREDDGTIDGMVTGGWYGGWWYTGASYSGTSYAGSLTVDWPIVGATVVGRGANGVVPPPIGDTPEGLAIAVGPPDRTGRLSGAGAMGRAIRRPNGRRMADRPVGR